MPTQQWPDPDFSMTPCADCGMPCKPGEYHPFAACLMFKACHNSDTVRANLETVQDRARQAPAPVEVSRLVLRDWETTCDDCCGTGKVDHSEPLYVDGRYMGEDNFRIPCDTCLSTGVFVCIADIPKEIQR